MCRLAASIRCANRGITGTCGSATCSRARRTLAYTTALDLPEGVLIYATEEGGAPDRAVDVRNTDHRLWTYRVDLTGNTGDVANELQLLSDWILDRTVALSPRAASWVTARRRMGDSCGPQSVGLVGLHTRARPTVAPIRVRFALTQQCRSKYGKRYPENASDSGTEGAT